MSDLNKIIVVTQEEYFIKLFSTNRFKNEEILISFDFFFFDGRMFSDISAIVNRLFYGSLPQVLHRNLNGIQLRKYHLK